MQCLLVSLVKKTLPAAAFVTWTAVSAVSHLAAGHGRCAALDAEAALHHDNALQRFGGALSAASRTCMSQQLFLLARDVLRLWGDGTIQRWWQNSHYGAPPPPSHPTSACLHVKYHFRLTQHADLEVCPHPA